MHPADQIVTIMNRIYENCLTTTTGGNISVMDGHGDIWITPSGVDKGSLTRRDICQVKPNGTVVGLHKPSMELPFHASVFKKRPDIKAVLHAHPPMMVAFSVVRQLPELRMVANIHEICGNISIAAYATPGSAKLGEIISAEFEKGFDIIMLENHGIVAGGCNVFECFKKFETLETAAKIHINASKLGTTKTTTSHEPALPATYELKDFTKTNHSTEECDARCEIISLIKRSYRQGLFGSTHGVFSVKLTDGSFLITPHCTDRAYLTEDDLVHIKGGMKEHGKIPSRSARLHMLIYEKNPGAGAIVAAAPPGAMAFAVTDTVFDPRTIPESYMVLRDIKKVGFSDLGKVAEMFSARTPVLICENTQIIATGQSPINAFDRLEVCEATAKAIIAAKDIGAMVHMSESAIRNIDLAFNLE